MKKLINGVSYNTETAKSLGFYDYGYPSDLSYFSETLLRTNSGKYFIYGEGGPQSKYSVQIRYNETCGGERILPVKYDEAKAWAEEHLDGDKYEVAFGEVEDAGIYIELDSEIRRIIEKVSSDTGMSIKQIIKNSIENTYK